MKSNRIILFLSFIAILTFSKCSQKCYNCLANGQNTDLPYTQNQTITFINDSLVKQSFVVSTRSGSSPYQYCGSLEQQYSYQACIVLAWAFVNYSNYKDSTLITVLREPDNWCCSSYFNGVAYNERTELDIFQLNVYFSQIGSPLSISGGTNALSNVMTSVSINGNQYNDVYVYQNDSTAINNCSYFAYSVANGLLKYSIKKTNYTQNWTLVQ